VVRAEGHEVEVVGDRDDGAGARLVHLEAAAAERATDDGRVEPQGFGGAVRSRPCDRRAARRRPWRLDLQPLDAARVGLGHTYWVSEIQARPEARPREVDALGGVVQVVDGQRAWCLGPGVEAVTTRPTKNATLTRMLCSLAGSRRERPQNGSLTDAPPSPRLRRGRPASSRRRRSGRVRGHGVDTHVSGSGPHGHGVTVSGGVCGTSACSSTAACSGIEGACGCATGRPARASGLDRFGRAHARPPGPRGHAAPPRGAGVQGTHLLHTGHPGPVFAVLPDAGRLQEEEAERANRKGYTKHKPALAALHGRPGQGDPDPAAARGV